MDGVCKYFGTCGGCSLQNLAPEAYGLYKTGLLGDALDKASLKCAEILPMIDFPTGSRMRANLKVDYGANVGFYKGKSRDVVGVCSCQLLHPDLNGLIMPLRELFKNLVKRSAGSVAIARADNGMAVHFGSGIGLMPLDMPAIRDFARDGKVIRVSQGNRILFESETPMIGFGGAQIMLPMDSFLQPGHQSRLALVETVKRFTESAKPAGIADLFCGIGFFSFSLAMPGVHVEAWDCDEFAVRNINIAANRAGLDVHARAADLFARPVPAKKLSEFGLAIVDPPRDGAAAQCSAIAKSRLRRLIYVSCNPKTFAKDAKVLCAAGFEILKIQPIDQFPYTSHLEIVAKLERRN
ncbi:MAG: hypothetical protein LBI17_04025 [Rickettsiales bacterium]|jgi:23S rRNA (uracil1939-C5)-methyltransferase|nr:hypothetical protein [Rickettsiales bacterium]